MYTRGTRGPGLQETLSMAYWIVGDVVVANNFELLGRGLGVPEMGLSLHHGIGCT